jgi:hypothetical protein
MLALVPSEAIFALDIVELLMFSLGGASFPGLLLSIGARIVLAI